VIIGANHLSFLGEPVGQLAEVQVVVQRPGRRIQIGAVDKEGEPFARMAGHEYGSVGKVENMNVPTDIDDSDLDLDGAVIVALGCNDKGAWASCEEALEAASA